MHKEKGREGVISDRITVMFTSHFHLLIYMSFVGGFWSKYTITFSVECCIFSWLWSIQTYQTGKRL